LPVAVGLRLPFTERLVYLHTVWFFTFTAMPDVVPCYHLLFLLLRFAVVGFAIAVVPIATHLPFVAGLVLRFVSVPHHFPVCSVWYCRWCGSRTVHMPHFLAEHALVWLAFTTRGLFGVAYRCALPIYGCRMVPITVGTFRPVR
jgi:hypothetical protein